MAAIGHIATLGAAPLIVVASVESVKSAEAARALSEAARAGVPGLIGTATGVEGCIAGEHAKACGQACRRIATAVRRSYRTGVARDVIHRNVAVVKVAC